MRVEQAGLTVIVGLVATPAAVVDADDVAIDPDVGSGDVEPVTDTLAPDPDVGPGDVAEVVEPPTEPIVVVLPEPVALDVLPGEVPHAMAALPNDGLVILTDDRLLTLEAGGAVSGQRPHSLTEMTKASLRVGPGGWVVASTGEHEAIEQAYSQDVWYPASFDVTTFAPTLRPFSRVSTGDGDDLVTLTDGTTVVWDDMRGNPDVVAPTPFHTNYGMPNLEPPFLQPELRVIRRGEPTSTPVSYATSDAAGLQRGTITDAAATPAGGVTFLRLTLVGEDNPTVPYDSWLYFSGLEIVRTTPVLDGTTAWARSLVAFDLPLPLTFLGHLPRLGVLPDGRSVVFLESLGAAPGRAVVVSASGVVEFEAQLAGPPGDDPPLIGRVTPSPDGSLAFLGYTGTPTTTWLGRYAPSQGITHMAAIGTASHLAVTTTGDVAVLMSDGKLLRVPRAVWAGAAPCQESADCASLAPAGFDPLCVAGDCGLVPIDGAPCDDGDPCTDGDVTAVDACVGTPLDCGGGQCTIDHCIAGVCAQTARVCEDGNPCTDDACDPLSGLCTASASATSGAALALWACPAVGMCTSAGFVPTAGASCDLVLPGGPIIDVMVHPAGGYVLRRAGQIDRVGPGGTTLWSTSLASLSDAEVLPDGRILAANGSRLLTLAPGGEVAQDELLGFNVMQLSASPLGALVTAGSAVVSWTAQHSPLWFHYLMRFELTHAVAVGTDDVAYVLNREGSGSSWFVPYFAGATQLERRRADTGELLSSTSIPAADFGWVTPRALATSATGALGFAYGTGMQALLRTYDATGAETAETAIEPYGAHPYDVTTDRLHAIRGLAAVPGAGWALAGWETLSGVPQGAWLAAVDAQGVVTWSHTYGGPTAKLWSVAARPGGGLVAAGERAGQGWLLFTDDAGLTPAGSP